MKNKPHRSGLEISIDILRIIAEGNSKKTHIMYKANLSYTTMNRYLNPLIEKSLIVFEKRRYSVSEKGYRTLMIGLELLELLGNE